MTRRQNRLLSATWLAAYSLATTVLPLVHNAWHSAAHGHGEHEHAHAHIAPDAASPARAHGGDPHAQEHAHHQPGHGLPVDRGSLADRFDDRPDGSHSHSHPPSQPPNSPSDPSHGANAPEHFGVATLAAPPSAAIAAVERRACALVALPSSQSGQGPARRSAQPRAPPVA